MRSALHEITGRIGEAILGKERQVRLALCCLLAKGHLLIEDLPGMGKTVLAHSLARVLGLQFKRIQFTSDLLPADIVGVSIYQSEQQAFHFLPGPVFAQLVLADEINRASPKTQSALLEAMEERQVTADGNSIKLPEPFFVIATQNPQHQVGTFPLPESQLDRFLMRISMGYPDRQAERRLLSGRDPRDIVERMQPALDPARLLALQQRVEEIRASAPLLDYVQDLLTETRQSALFTHGLSPRAGLGLLRCARAWALLEGRDMVIPEDVQTVAPYVLGHRLQAGALRDDAARKHGTLVEHLLHAVAIP
jgi:MoxR-like ATPase